MRLAEEAQAEAKSSGNPVKGSQLSQADLAERDALFAEIEELGEKDLRAIIEATHAKGEDLPESVIEALKQTPLA